MSLNTPKNRKLRLCTRAQSRQIDLTTIDSYGLDGAILMEIAGLKASEIIHNLQGSEAHGIYFCGKGNNAGDAFVIARYLSDIPNHKTTIFLASGSDDLSVDAEKNLGLLRQLADHNPLIEIADELNEDKIPGADYIVDGMIGTGLSSKLREPLLSAVERINKSAATVFSLDIPTGLDCDTGNILGNAVISDHTITFGTNKIGFYLEKGPETCGEVHFVELPFPQHLREHSATLIQTDLLSETKTVLKRSEHKYQQGIVHVIAGSAGMTGAAIMSAKSAWKAGAGAVFLYAPKGLLAVYEQTLPQIIKVPVGSKNDTSFKPGHSEIISNKIANKPGPVLMGPGLGRSDDTVGFTRKLLGQLTQQVILDADALFGWSTLEIENMSDWIITPHIGELKNSLGLEFTTDKERLIAIQKIAKKHKCTVLSKGYPAIVADTNHTYITGYDTRIFAKAGFGDVLAGTIAGKLAVSRSQIESVINAMLDNFITVNHSAAPEPQDIYDR